MLKTASIRRRVAVCCVFVLFLSLPTAGMDPPKTNGEEGISQPPEPPKPEPPKGPDPFHSGEGFCDFCRIDTLLRESLAKDGLQPAPMCSDAVFVRRIYLDVTGTLPSVEEVREFLENPSDGKHAALIDKLLASEEYVDFQTLRWCDMLRVKAEFPINLWPNGAACYYRWIRQAVAENRPYDRMVREFLTSSGSNFRDGAANFYRAVPSKDAETLAEAIAQSFLGLDIGPWPEDKRRQLALFFSRVGYKETAQWKEEIVYWTRQPVDADEYIFPDGSRKPADRNRDPRRDFADWLVAPENRPFQQTAVNRVWTWLFGAGLLVEAEDLKAESKSLPEILHPELLDELCTEFVRSGYDLKHLYRMILNSGVYRQSAIAKDSGNPGATEAARAAKAASCFAAYPIRRIEAEVFQDMLARLFDVPVGYISEVPEPYTHIPPRYRTILLPDSSITSSFLEMFGRASRDTGTASDRNNAVTESQQLFLLNSTEVNNWVSRATQKFRNLPKRPEEIAKMIDEIWLTFLSRYPTEAERQIAIEELRRTDKPNHQKAQDLIWSLLNTKEFLCKH